MVILILSSLFDKENLIDIIEAIKNKTSETKKDINIIEKTFRENKVEISISLIKI